MIVPDINVLLYAHLDTFPRHREARAWFEQTLSEASSVGLCAPVVFGFVRLVTNPRIFTPPMSVESALALVREWLAQPRVRWLVAGPGHVEHVFALLAAAGTASNLTTDAQIAAYALEHHATVASTDTDFGRFSGVKWVDPLRSTTIR